MNSTTYNTLTLLLAAGVLAALAVMAISFVATIVRWKTPWRRRHVIRLFLAGAAVLSLIGVQQAILWLVFLPSLGREQMARARAAREARAAASSLVHVGDPAPDFSLMTADGEEFTLSEAKGKVVVINFFATWCGPCLTELPHIEQLWTEHGGREDFRLLVIGREESLEVVREFRADRGFSFPIAADPEREVYSRFAGEIIPRTLIVSPEGQIVYSQVGFYAEDLPRLKDAIQKQLKTEP